MYHRRLFLGIFPLILLLLYCRQQQQPLLHFTVTNPADWDRETEIISLPLAGIGAIDQYNYKILEKA